MDNYIHSNIFEPYLIKSNSQIDSRVAHIIALCSKANCINFFKYYKL